MPNYTANQLSAFSAIIARAATSRNWGTATETNDTGAAVQEVQCMIMDNKLYIAGNHTEHLSIIAYLNAFGVHDQTSFERCMRYSYWLLNLPFPGRNAATGRPYAIQLSAQETAALALAPWPLTLLTDDEVAAATALARGTTVGPTAAQQHLGWFLRKFVGAGPKASAPYQKAQGATNVRTVTNTVQPQEVCVISNGQDIHAEIKLLSFMFEITLTNQVFLGNGAVAVGGLKKTCLYCQNWIGLFGTFLQRQYKIGVNLPTLDTRAVGGGAGRRPTSGHIGAFGNYVNTLFDGAANSTCADVRAHVNDEAW